jgi:hypothetical protein
MTLIRFGKEQPTDCEVPLYSVVSLLYPNILLYDEQLSFSLGFGGGAKNNFKTLHLPYVERKKSQMHALNQFRVNTDECRRVFHSCC